MFELNPMFGALIGAQEAERYRRNREAREEASLAAEWEAYAHQLEHKLAVAEGKLAVSGAKLDGAAALLRAFQQAHPDSPLLGLTGHVYSRGANAGRRKTRCTLVWERAFDASAKRLGIANPAALRED